MATGKRPDPRRKKNQAPHSTYLKVKPGEKFGGWSAGEYYGCYAHRTHSTQPCSANITDDAMQCPYCLAGQIPVWRGWVPVWDVDWVLRHVVIGEEIAPSVDAIPYRAPVVITRAKNPISPLVIREDASMVNRQLPAGLPWSQPVSMLAVCLVLWNIPALTRWCEDRNLLALAPRTIEDCDTKPSAKPVKALPKTSAYTAPMPTEQPLYEGLEDTLNRVKALEAAGKVTPNGKHGKKNE